MGVDDNVFNEETNPKRDTVATLSPAVNLGLNAGPTVLSGRVGGQYVYYAKYENERVWGATYDAKCEVPFGRWTPFLLGSYMDTRNRVGCEIDGRVHQTATAYGGGVKVEFSGRTTITALARRASTAFDDEEVFRGVALSAPLNQSSDEAGLEVRYGLTPLTTIVVATYGGNDRFELDPLRNADNYRTVGGFEFQPFALISGSVMVGVFHFSAKDPRLEDAQTFTMSGDLTYHVGGTSASVTVARDRSYSFEATDPYYFLTNVGVSVTQRIGGPWDVVVRGERGSLAYQSLDSENVEPVPELARRVDALVGYGAGIGYRIGRNLRVGVDWRHMERESVQLQANYRRTRIGASLAYELGQ